MTQSFEHEEFTIKSYQLQDRFGIRGTWLLIVLELLKTYASVSVGFGIAHTQLPH